MFGATLVDWIGGNVGDTRVYWAGGIAGITCGEWVGLFVGAIRGGRAKPCLLECHVGTWVDLRLDVGQGGFAFYEVV